MKEDDKLKLQKRIHNQRARLRFFEENGENRNHYWRLKAMSYRKQLIDNGITPKVSTPVIVGLHKLKTGKSS